jgi:hypothetical protein
MHHFAEKFGVRFKHLCILMLKILNHSYFFPCIVMAYSATIFWLVPMMLHESISTTEIDLR